MLRKAGEAGPAYTRRITISDLTTTSAPVATERRGAKGTTTIEVVRGASRQEYSVPSENPRQRAVEAVGEPVGEPEHLGN
jgi:hypothetical protein